MLQGPPVHIVRSWQIERREGEGGEVETFLGLRALGVGPKKAIVNNAGLATDRNGKKEEAWNRLK